MAIILVTGATGTVGSSLVRELSKRGAPVRAGVHSLSRAESISGLNIEIAQVDYQRPDTVRAALQGVASLYLLTPFSPEQADTAAFITDCAKEAGVKHIVRQSGMGAGTMDITAARIHRQAEQYIESTGIPFTFLRPNSFMQNFINYSGYTIRTEAKIYLPLGEGKVSYIDARDIASAAAEVLTKGGHYGKAYDLTGPEAISVYKVAEAFSEAHGRVITYIDVPEEAARRAMLALGLNEWAAGALMELNSLAKSGGASRVSGAVKEITGREPRSFEEFARDHANLLS